MEMSQVSMGMVADDGLLSASDLSPLQPFNPVFLAANVRLQRPLSRRGKGPALIIFLPDQDHRPPASKTTLDPAPLQKWAEEGFAVAEVTIGGLAPSPTRDVLSVQDACERSAAALNALPECTSDGQVGVIGR